MQNTPNDESTRLQRPVLASLNSKDISHLDASEIGYLAAINPLIAAANPLLMTVTSLRPGSAPGNVDALRLRLIDMVREFDVACAKAGIPEEHQHISRYCLCTLIDETIQRTAWSHTANWAQRSLSIHFFKDNKGGEKFFVILDKLVQSPGNYSSVLQLFYVCLSLGFMGRYLMRDAQGRQEISDLRDRLYQQVIRPTVSDGDKALSINWQGLMISTRQFRGFGMVWMVVGTCLLLCLMFYTAYFLRLASWRDEVGIGALSIPAASVAKVADTTPPSKPRLPQLLANEISARQLKIQETAAESVVTLASEFTFASGSATLSSGVIGVIERVADALDKVEGQVVVTGHTDNVPSRSLQFPSNYELSRARAQSVAELLRAHMDAPSRVTYEGRADSEPLNGQSNGSPEGRAANRRVEISLRVSSVGQ